MKKMYDTIIKAEEGNALLLVMILLLSLMMMGGTALYITSTQAQITHVYKRHSDLYLLAQSGAEMMVDRMNKEMAGQLTLHIYEVLQELKRELDESEYRGRGELEWLLNEEDPYRSLYQLKPDQQKTLAEKIRNKVYEHIKHGEDFSPFAYSVEGSEDVTVTVRLLSHNRNGTAYERQCAETGSETDKPQFIVLSTVEKAEGGRSIKTTAIAEVFLWNDAFTEQITEAYRWQNGLPPNHLRSGILTYGDLLVKGAEVQVKGDIRARGYLPAGTQKDGDEYGGIYVLDGGKLTVEGSAYTASNLHTKRTYGPEGAAWEAGAEILIQKDAIANAIGIEDNYFLEDGMAENPTPWDVDTQPQNHRILIQGDAYTDDDLRIGRYVEEGTIAVGGSFFGVSKTDPSGSETDPDPNKSSGIYNQGNHSVIRIGQKAFVHGNAYISYGGSFYPLHESIGEPYDDVYDLLITHGRIPSMGVGVRSYILDFFEIVKKGKVLLGTSMGGIFKGFSQRLASANDQVYDMGVHGNQEWEAVLNDINDAVFFFNQGLKRPETEEKEEEIIAGLKAINDKWEALLPDSNQSVAALIYDAKPYFLQKNYVAEEVFGRLGRFQGVEGYMYVMRDIFYEGIGVEGHIAAPMPADFGAKVVRREIFTENGEWTYDHPLKIITGMDEANIEIDLSTFYIDRDPIPTVIIDNRPKGTITLKAGSEKNQFKGYIISRGKVVFGGNQAIRAEGVILTGGLQTGGDLSPRQIEQGAFGGVVFTTNTEVLYNPEILFAVEIQDMGVKRRLMDYLRLTDYGAGRGMTEAISMSEKTILGLQHQSIDNIRWVIQTMRKEE